MTPFMYFQPTEIRFGSGRVQEIGAVTVRYGKRALLVTSSNEGVLSPTYARVRALLQEVGIAVEHFDGVMPNPTTTCVSDGAALAKAFHADVIIGLGGGSSMDTAKAIAVEATHPGSCWDYLFFRDTQPTARTLPVIAVSTTSGTGSQVTQVAVVTETASKTKSALYHPLLYPKAAILDPELMLTLPPIISAATGFDAFTHAFEAYLHVNTSPYVELLALEAMRLIAHNLPLVLTDGHNLTARAAMSWGDTLAGLCIANAGVTLPHGIGMTIGGQCPQVAHGQALAVIYPEFVRFTFEAAVAKFASMGRILNPSLVSESDAHAAEASCAAMDSFLKRTRMWLSLSELGITSDDMVAIADHSLVLPDYRNNPRIATRDDIYDMLCHAYERA